jgi:RNA polymerase sigma factor (sigma-70 family)
MGDPRPPSPIALSLREAGRPVTTRVRSGITFEVSFQQAFDEHFSWLFRYVDRDTDDDALAADIAQESFVRLYQRGAMPEEVRAWLVSVANNLIRDEHRRRTRRARLLAQRSPDHTVADAPLGSEERVLAKERRMEVRMALDTLTERDRRLLLLHHQGLSYRELAVALAVGETSVGTLLARAHNAFRDAFCGAFPGRADAP